MTFNMVPKIYIQEGELESSFMQDGARDLEDPNLNPQFLLIEIPLSEPISLW